MEDQRTRENAENIPPAVKQPQIAVVQNNAGKKAPMNAKQMNITQWFQRKTPIEPANPPRTVPVVAVPILAPQPSAFMAQVNPFLPARVPMEPLPNQGSAPMMVPMAVPMVPVVMPMVSHGNVPQPPAVVVRPPIVVPQSRPAPPPLPELRHVSEIVVNGESISPGHYLKLRACYDFVSRFGDLYSDEFPEVDEGLPCSLCQTHSCSNCSNV